MTTEISADSLTVTRTVTAPPAAVWQAWTEPAILEQWYCPDPQRDLSAKVDLRVGGAWQVAMGADICSGQYEVVDEPRRLVFTYSWADSPQEVTRVEVTFTGVPQGTEVTLVQTGFASASSTEGHAEGWEMVLDRLPEVF